MKLLRLSLLLGTAFWLCLSQSVIADDDVEDASAIAFYHADANQDGVVDEAEYASDAIAAFTLADTDDDHRLKAHELKGADADRISKIDKNKDAELDFDEVMANKTALFAVIDKDGDGVLTLEETVEYNEKQ
jgi:hypothetical protein